MNKWQEIVFSGLNYLFFGKYCYTIYTTFFSALFSANIVYIFKACYDYATQKKAINTFFFYSSLTLLAISIAVGTFSRFQDPKDVILVSKINGSSDPYNVHNIVYETVEHIGNQLGLRAKRILNYFNHEDESDIFSCLNDCGARVLITGNYSEHSNGSLNLHIHTNSKCFISWDKGDHRVKKISISNSDFEGEVREQIQRTLMAFKVFSMFSFSSDECKFAGMRGGNKKEFDKVKEWIDSPVANKELKKDFYLLEANHLFNQKKYNEAFHKISQAIEVYGESVELLETRALVMYKGHDYNSSLADIDKAISIEPENAKLLNNKAIILRVMGDISYSQQLYQDSVNLAKKSNDEAFLETVSKNYASLLLDFRSPRETLDFLGSLNGFQIINSGSLKDYYLQALVKNRDYAIATSFIRQANLTSADIKRNKLSICLALIGNNELDGARYHCKGQPLSSGEDVATALANLQRGEKLKPVYQGNNVLFMIQNESDVEVRGELKLQKEFKY